MEGRTLGNSLKEGRKVHYASIPSIGIYRGEGDLLNWHRDDTKCGLSLLH